MKGKILGILGLLVVLIAFTSVRTATGHWYQLGTSTFLQPNNIENLLTRISMAGILAIGVAFVIITSGIDLSIGSLVCLSGVLLALFLHVDYNEQAALPVGSVSRAGNAFVLSESPPAQPAEGTRMRYVGGVSASRLFTVERVAVGDDGPTTIVMAESPALDETAGRLIPTRPVISVTKISDPDSGAAAEVLIDGTPDAAPRDKLALINATFGLSEQEIVSVEPRGTQLLVRVRNDPGDRFRDGCVAYLRYRHQRMPIPLALLSVVLIGAAIGTLHGQLVTRARMQPFVVTLCGLMIYRGLARWLTSDNPAGFGEFQAGLGQISTGSLSLTSNASIPSVPYPFFLLLVTGAMAAVFLNRTIWGRYLMALGRSETAARFSGINTNRVTLMAYTICSTLAAVGGILWSLDSNSISPSGFGNFFELYAIAAAVLGGCSLRGGEGTIAGVLIGTAVMQILNNMINLLKISQPLESVIIGLVLLAGVFADESIKRLAARRRQRQNHAA